MRRPTLPGLGEGCYGWHPLIADECGPLGRGGRWRHVGTEERATREVRIGGRCRRARKALGRAVWRRGSSYRRSRGTAADGNGLVPGSRRRGTGRTRLARAWQRRDCPDAATYALPEGQAKADVLSASRILRERTRSENRMRLNRKSGSMSGDGRRGNGYNSGIGNRASAAGRRLPLRPTDTVPILDSVDSWKRGETPKSR
jgi:hypothetical protein